MQVIPWDESADGPLHEAALAAKMKAFGCRVARYVYPPGTVFGAHTHEVDKIDAVIEGRFRMQMQGAEVILGAGDMLAVPAGVLHSAEVVGDEAVVSLDGICQG